MRFPNAIWFFKHQCVLKVTKKPFKSLDLHFGFESVVQCTYEKQMGRMGLGFVKKTYLVKFWLFVLLVD